MGSARWPGHAQKVLRSFVVVGYGSESPSVVLKESEQKGRGGREYKDNRSYSTPRENELHCYQSVQRERDGGRERLCVH